MYNPKLPIIRRKIKHRIIKLQDGIGLSRNNETYDREIKLAIPDLKENLSTAPGRKYRHSLSRATTPEISLTAIKNTDLKKISFLVKVKDFEDYVRDAIQTGLLVKQYEVRT